MNIAETAGASIRRAINTKITHATMHFPYAEVNARIASLPETVRGTINGTREVINFNVNNINIRQVHPRVR